MQSLGEAQVSEGVPLTDLRGANVEDGGDFPVVPGTPPTYLVVQVADMEEQGSCEGQEEISSEHSVLPAPPMRARSVAINSFHEPCPDLGQDKSFFIWSNSSFLISPRAYRFFKISRGVSVSLPEG